jgi:hypothetical protein
MHPDLGVNGKTDPDPKYCGIVQGISKLSGQAKASTYPQPEGTLGDAMSTYGNKLLDFDNRYPVPNAVS